MLHKSLAFNIKATGDQNGVATFEGYASTFGNIDRGGDVLVKGAFADTIESFLSEGVLLAQHKSTDLIGRPLEAREDENGLWMKGEICLDVEKGRENYALMKAGILKKMSIGFDIDDYELLSEKNIEQYAPGASPVDIARAINYWGYAIKRVTLYEVSPVSIPANPLADITAVKNAEGLRLDEHFRTALAVVTGLKERAAQLKQLRAQENRTLSQSARDQLEELQREMSATGAQMKALLDDFKTPDADGQTAPTEPAEPAPSETGTQLKERLAARRASLQSKGIALTLI